MGFASCGESTFCHKREIDAVESVKVTSTTITFKFKGVDKPQTYAIAACQNGEGSTVYKVENAVEVEKDQVCSVSTISTAKVMFLLVVFAIIIFVIGIFLWFAIKDMFFT